jgi:hypothetical protein
MATFVRTRISYVTRKPDGKGGWVDIDERVCWLHNLCISGDAELAIQEAETLPPAPAPVPVKEDLLSKLKKGVKK